MLRMAVIASIVLAIPSCRTSLEEELDAPPTGQRACVMSTSAACMEAVNHSDLAWIETNVFMASCTFSGCHNGQATAAGTMDIRSGMAHTHLVNIDSQIEAGRKLVVPGQVNQSYLMMMLRHFRPDEMDPPVSPPPASVGFMPQNAGGAVQCCQKLDALERWIAAGALPN